MTQSGELNGGGSGRLWGQLFGLHAETWAETWEGPNGWGSCVYDRVLEGASIGTGVHVLDCGCGAGRFARLAADRGARVTGLDASAALVGHAAAKVPTGEFVIGDMEALPWQDGTFDVVVGLSSFQFAEDSVGALREARRVSLERVAAVVPADPKRSAIAAVLKPVLPLFSSTGLEALKESGIFALSEADGLHRAMSDAGMAVVLDEEIDCAIRFDDIETACHAFMGAGPVALATQNSGRAAVGNAVRDGLEPFEANGRVILDDAFRFVIGV